MLQWVAEGKIKTCRTEGNHRLIMKEDLIDFLDNKGLIIDDTINQKRDILYARVSSNEQKKNGDLDRQVLFLVENIPNLMNPFILKDVGSGLNEKRTNFQKLLTMVCKNEVRNVYVTDKDRLTRFGFYYLETLFSAYDVKIIIVEDKTPLELKQRELV